MDTKICTRCKQEKQLNEFSTRKNRPCGYYSFCKQCYREYRKIKQTEEYKDPEKKALRLQRNTKNKKLNRGRIMKWIINYLENHSCIDCGESDPIVLDFDHLYDKCDNICTLTHTGYGLDKIILEIQKCVVRCSNCHRKKTAKDFNHLKYRFLEGKNEC